MSSIKGIVKLNNTLNKFTKKFDCIAIPDTDFYCITTRNLVAYSFLTPVRCSKSFMSRVRRLYPDIQADEFLWSFLHEIGHLETDDELTEEEFAYIDSFDFDTISDEDYYELPNEYLATQWAADYMRQHPAEIAKFWKKVQKQIMYIYRINGLI